MKRLLTSLMLLISIGFVALSMAGNHGQGIDWQQLDLTELQDQKIQNLNKNYHERFQILRKQALDAETKEIQLVALRQEVVAEMKKILTAEQKQLASEVIVSEMESRINKRLERVLNDLALTPKQEDSLKHSLSTRFNKMQDQRLVLDIPDFNDKQQMFDQLDKVLPQLLTSEQVELWQQMKYKRQLHLESSRKSAQAVIYSPV